MSDEVAEKKPPTLDQVMERYVQLRDKKEELAKAQKLELKKFSDALDKLETYIALQMDNMGVDSTATKFGTAYFSTKFSTGIADWDALLKFIRENEAWHALDKRVNKTFVESFKEEHNDLPPGVTYEGIRAVNVRRK